jgi:nucleotide-binding universal stress UspA family protein
MMDRILVATDLSAGAHDALGRAVAMARQAGAELRIVAAWPDHGDQDECSIARARLRDEIALLPGAPARLELDLSIRMPRGEPVDAILREAARFRPDLIVLGAHGEPRFRDAIFGTTASRVAREADHPVLIVQNDHRRPYETLLAAVDERSAEEVLRLATGFAGAKDLYVVHATGSLGQGLFGDGETLEAIREDQEAMTRDVAELVKTFSLGALAPRIHTIVEQGEASGVIMKAWETIRPDLLVMATAGRAGLARLLHGSHAETAILGCTSDILVARTRASA